MTNEEHEKFYPKLKKTVSGSFFVTLRKEVVEVMDWKENDILEVLVKKRE